MNLSRHRLEAIIRRFRYLTQVCLHPLILGNGPWISMGKRVEFKFTHGASLRRGKGLIISSDSRVIGRGLLTFGDDVFVGVCGHLVAFERVSIGSRVRIGERVSIHDENHVFEPYLPGALNADYSTAPVEIGSDVWIGAQCVILPGSKIGSGSVIGAGSVVRGDIPEAVLAAGVPARVIRSLVR